MPCESFYSSSLLKNYPNKSPDEQDHRSSGCEASAAIDQNRSIALSDTILSRPLSQAHTHSFFGSSLFRQKTLSNMSSDGQDHPSKGGVNDSRIESTIPGNSERLSMKRQPEKSSEGKEEALLADQRHGRSTGNNTQISSPDSFLSPSPCEIITSNNSDGDYQQSETKTDESSGLDEGRKKKESDSIPRRTANSRKAGNTALPGQDQRNEKVIEDLYDRNRTGMINSEAEFLAYIETLKDDREAQRARTKMLTKQLVELKEAKAEKDAEYTRLSTRFLEVQKNAMDRLRENCSNAMPDDIIEVRFYDFAGRYGAWCKKYGYQSVENWSSITSAVKKMLVGSGGVNNWKSQRCLDFAKNGAITVRAILAAVMMRLAFISIMQDPFFWDGPRGATGGKKNQTPGLQWIEDQLRSVSGEKATLWRSLSVQIVNPTQDGKLASRESEKLKGVSEKKEKVYEQSAKRVIEVCETLLQPLDEGAASRRREELVSLCRFLGEIMSGVYAQNLRIQVLFSQEHFTELGATEFSESSELMSAHRSVELSDDEENDESKNSRPVDLLVQPAIIAYSNNKLGTENEYRVWLKAIVWMGSDAMQIGPTALRKAGAKAAGTLKGVIIGDKVKKTTVEEQKKLFSADHASKREDSAGRAFRQGTLEVKSSPRKSVIEEAMKASSPNLLARDFRQKRRHDEDISGSEELSKKPKTIDQETAETRTSGPSTHIRTSGSNSEPFVISD